MNPAKSSTMAFYEIRVIIIIFMLLLIGLEIIPLNAAGMDAQYLGQATLQRLHCQVFAKSAYTLANRSGEEKDQAFGDLQFVLPLFEQEEIILLKNTDSSIQKSLQQAKPEYEIVVTAVQNIINQPEDAFDIHTINIILQNYQACTNVMSNVANVVQQTIEKQRNWILSAEVGIEILFIIFLAFLLILQYVPLNLKKEN